jgi:hypothetical protein
MGYKQELEQFIACAQGNISNAPRLENSFSTMAVIFAIERALAMASVECLT